MSAPSHPRATPARRQKVRQVLTGLVVLPLSAIPFLAYGLFTPEGRTLRDRLVVAVASPKLPDLSPVQHQNAAATAPRFQGKVMALAYHGVGAGSDDDNGSVVSPRRFGEQLAMLRAAGMVSVTAQDVARAFSGDQSLPDNAVMITFDGGRADALLFADPLLEQAGMRATLFVDSSGADRANLSYAGWSAIVKAARSGRWDIEALTSRQPGESLVSFGASVREDLDRGIAAVEDHVGRPPVAFAYPFGVLGDDQALVDIVRGEIASRYVIAFDQPDQDSVSLIDPGQDRLGLNRLEVGNWSGADLLGRIRHAADPATGAIDAEAPADTTPADLELVAPPPPPDPDPTTTTTAAPTPQPEPRPGGGRPPVKVGETSRPAKPSATTTSTRPSTTSTTTAAPATTTTSSVPPTSSTTTTTTRRPRPTTTTTTAPATTSTTRPSDPPTTTTTSEEDWEERWKEWCKENPDHRYCRR